MIGDPLPARGRTRRQDAADRRAGRDRRAPRPAGQGVRHARHRAAARPGAGRGAADAVQPMSELCPLCREADIVALTCPLTPETENLIDADGAGADEALRLSRQCRARAGGRRGRACRALRRRRIAGAGIDVTARSRWRRDRHYGGWRKCSSPHIRPARRAATRTT